MAGLGLPHIENSLRANFRSMMSPYWQLRHSENQLQRSGNDCIRILLVHRILALNSHTVAITVHTGIMN